MNGTWIHLNLKTIEILKDQTQKINTCSKSTVGTRRHMFKVNTNDSRGMTSFYSDVDRGP